VHSQLLSGLAFCKFALAFACVLFVPGYLVFNLFFSRKEHDLFEIIPVATVFSIALLSIVGMVLYLVKSNVNSLMLSVPVLVPLFIALNIGKWRRNRRARPAIETVAGEPDVKNAQRGRTLIIALWCLLILAAALMAYSGAMFVWTSDTYDHVGTVREIVEKREILPVGAFYGAEEHLGPDPRKGLLHTLLAVLSIVTKIEPFQIWLWLPIFMLPILLCSYLAFADSLFKNRNIAFLSTVLFMMCVGGLERSHLRMVGFPGMVAFQLYLIALYFMFKYLERRKASFFLASALLGSSAALVHVYYLFQYLLALGSLLVFCVLFWKQSRAAAADVGKLVLVTLLLSAPWLAVRYKLSYGIANPVDAQPRHLLFITKNVFVTNPLETWSIVGPMGILGLAATPFLFRRARADVGMRFLFSAMIITPLIIFNPVAVQVLGRIMTFGLVRRIVQFAPYIAVTGYFVYSALCSLRGGGLRGSKLKAVLFLALFVLLLIPYLRGFATEYSRASIEAERKHSYLQWQDALRFMRDRIPGPSVILSDPLTSYSIPAFTQHAIVDVLIGHSSPQDAQNINRLVAADDVLNPYVDLERTIEILNRYHVQYVVVNQTFTESLYESYWSIDLKNYEATRRKFESHPVLFESIYDRNRVYIYKYHSAGEGSAVIPEEPLSLPFVLRREPTMDVVNAVFAGRFVLMGATIGERTVSRGGRLKMRCYWTCNRPDIALENYKVFVRFDTQYKKSLLYRKSFSKIYRFILQEVTGRRYRFRSEHNPVNGSYPPRLWKRGEIIEDEFEIAVPSDVSRGTYDIKVNLLSLTHGMNYSLQDLFSDSDVYEGTRVGSVTIE
jgi:hypothetical protein